MNKSRALTCAGKDDVHLVILQAPAGYGKSLFATHLAAAHPIVCRFDCASSEVAVNPLHARNFWGAGTALILESFECLPAEDAKTLLQELMQGRPAAGVLIVCARHLAPSLRPSDFAEPHETTILRRDDLALQEFELRQLFPSVPRLAQIDVFQIRNFTGGWRAAALACARVFSTGNATGDFSSPGAFTEFFEYVDAEIFARLPENVLAAFCACAAFAGVHPAEIEGAFGAESADRICEQLVKEYQVASLGETGCLEVLPVLVLAARALRAETIKTSLLCLTTYFLKSGQSIRAAQCSLYAGDIEAAEAQLAGADPDYAALQMPTLLGAIESGAEGNLQWFPHVWSALFVSRMFAEPPEVLAREANSILDSLDDGAHENTVNNFAALAAIASRYASQIDRVHSALARSRPMPTAICGASLRLLSSKAIAAAHEGRFEDAQELWHNIQRYAGGDHIVNHSLVRIEIYIARAGGRWAQQQQALDQMILIARASRIPSLMAIALGEAVFGAWLAGEDDELDLYRAMLGLQLKESPLKGLENFNSAINGEAPLRDDHYPSSPWDARAYLICAVNSRMQREAIDFAKRAIQCSDEALNGFGRVFSRVVLAEVSSADRAVAIEEAGQIAGALQSKSLQDDFKKLAQLDAPAGVFEPILQRIRGGGAERRGPLGGHPQLTINVTDGSCLLGETTVKLPRGEMALLLALAVEDKLITRETLCDRLWPDLSSASASNALKTSVGRVRKRLGDGS